MKPTHFPEATCGFRRRDVTNCALNSGVGKTRTGAEIVVLENRDGSATYESEKRRANIWTMMNSTGRADMELATMGKGGPKMKTEDKKGIRQET